MLVSELPPVVSSLRIDQFMCVFRDVGIFATIALGLRSPEPLVRTTTCLFAAMADELHIAAATYSVYSCTGPRAGLDVTCPVKHMSATHGLEVTKAYPDYCRRRITNRGTAEDVTA